MPEKLALFGGTPIRTRPFPGWPVFGKSEEKRLLAVLRGGKWGRLAGTEVEQFEKRFAKSHGCKHGIAVVNGTVSLRIALMASGVRAGDEVIVPSYTFFSTASAVVEANAFPVFVDIDPNTFNIDPRAVEKAITTKTCAIVPVHFAGLPAAMNELMNIAGRTRAGQRRLVVIEDAAHAHGAMYQGSSAGSLGHMASFSFQSSKNMTAGEGGIITTNDDALAEACRSIQNCGRVPGGLWYEHHVMSGNYRLGEFQGAILNAQLQRLGSQTRTRDGNGKWLDAQLRRLPGLYPQQRSIDCDRHSYHLFMLRLDPGEFGAPRALVVKALQAEGIPCVAGYGFPLYQQPMFMNAEFRPYLPPVLGRMDYQKVRCPNSELLCEEQSIWLEHRLLLGTRADAGDIVKAFRKIHAQRDSLNGSQTRQVETDGPPLPGTPPRQSGLRRGN